MKAILYWKPILISIFIFFGSMASNENIDKVSFFDFNNSDKLIHFILYLMLSVTLQSSFSRVSVINRKKQILLTLLIVISYGLLMEVFQYIFTNNRSAEFLDVVANTFGCICGIILIPYLQKFIFSKYL